MIVNDRITAYIQSLDAGNGPLLDSIEEEALADCVPIIRRETSAFLKTLIALKRPQSILEVGTAVGYSALLMRRVMTANCRITTNEKYEKRIPIAKRNFERAGQEPCITLLEGDAEEILGTLSGPYDFIFMDAAKAQYIVILPEILRLLKPGAVLITDNVLQEGEIIEPRFGVTRRNRTIYERMREYLYAVTHCDELETTIVPIGDGITLSVRK